VTGVQTWAPPNSADARIMAVFKNIDLLKAAQTIVRIQK
jgi:hypothetical protein